jgi:hypothetical protein
LDSNWATEQLQTIRTLMERSAIYRRALAPVMLCAGIIGTVAAVLGIWLKITPASIFIIYWMCVGVGAVIATFFIVRRQALKDSEPLWSPPARRVFQAMLPTLVAGFLLGTYMLIEETRQGIADPPTGGWDAGEVFWLPAAWAILYGCALHSAGFFTHRGIKLFGWIFLVLGSAFYFWLAFDNRLELSWQLSHALMGFFFGVLHLAYGAYLYLTERGKNAA